MNLNEFAKEVHQNAIDHGWWGEEYTDAVAIALIHAEISEALESWRNNEPPVWYRCNMEPDKSQTCGGENCGYACMSASGSHWDAEERDCAARKRKPEGFAAELIDVVLRILDTAAAWGVTLEEWVINPSDSPIRQAKSEVVQQLTVPELVCELHRCATDIRHQRELDVGSDLVVSAMIYPLDLIFTWLRIQNFDPEALMREKHEYNKTRPYKHGGKRV